MSDTLAIIPTYLRNDRDLNLTLRAVASLYATSDAEILIVDDCSPNRELTRKLSGLRKFAPCRVILKRKNEGFAKTVNYGLREAIRKRQHGLLVNADIQFFDNGWLDTMRANDADVVGALLIYPNGLVQHAGIYFSVINRAFDHIFRMMSSKADLVQNPRICPVTGALQLIKNNTLNKIGVYDENFKMGWEDVDYCHMVFQAGMKCAYEPRAVAIHYESMFRGRDVPEHIQQWTIESFRYLHEKHRGLSFADYVPTLIWPDEI